MFLRCLCIMLMIPFSRCAASCTQQCVSEVDRLFRTAEQYDCDDPAQSDRLLALEYYRQAASYHDPRAEYALGCWYETGKKADSKANSFWRRLCRALYCQPCYITYCLEQDRERALHWYQRAVRHGHELAELALQRLKAGVSNI